MTDDPDPWAQFPVVPEDGTTPPPSAAPSAGWWEDRGMGGKVWHPADRANSSDVGRGDVSVAGLPPELVALGTIGVARAAAAPLLSAGQRVVAGGNALAAQASPIVKYQLVKSGLEHLGVPTPWAMGAAFAFSGYRALPGEAPAAAEDAAAALPERNATPWRSADGSWGYKSIDTGEMLKPGDTAHVVTKSGKMFTTIVPASIDAAADLRQANLLVSGGMSLAEAAAKVSEGSAARYGKIMSAFMQGAKP